MHRIMDTKLYEISNDPGIESEIRNYCGLNIGTDVNSNFTLRYSEFNFGIMYHA